MPDTADTVAVVPDPGNPDRKVAIAAIHKDLGAARVRVFGAEPSRATVRFTAGLAPAWEALPEGLRHGIMVVVGGAEPGWRALEHVEVGDVGGDFGHELEGRRAGADDGDALA